MSKDNFRILQCRCSNHVKDGVLAEEVIRSKDPQQGRCDVDSLVDGTDGHCKYRLEQCELGSRDKGNPVSAEC